MLITPFGQLRLFIDKVETNFTPNALPPIPKVAPDVLGRFEISYPYRRTTGGIRNIRLVLDVAGTKWATAGSVESGERLECISFYGDEYVLSIGTNGSSVDWMDYGFDYDVQYYPDTKTPCGLDYVIFEETRDRVFVFGVAWAPIETDCQTWFAAEPRIR
jgi:hypothetical protein